MGDVDGVPLARLTDTTAPAAAGTFARLFAAEYRRVVSVAYRVLADAAEAEDVAQEVFVAFHRRHAPDAPYAAAWLHAAAAHQALNVLRGARRRRQRESAQAEHERDIAIDPARQLEAAETRREVRSALARLSPKSASVLALRYSGLSYAEVAAALGVGVGQVGTLLRRAEAALRKEMARGTPR